MLKIGITGGIGSGKTTVCQVFETLGIPVFYADDAGKFLMNTDAGLRKQIENIFGEQAYQDNVLQTAFIAKEVFEDPDKLQALNALVHPAVIAFGEAWMLRQTGVPYMIKESALFFESGSNKQMDLIIGISAPETLRIERVRNRSRLSEEEVLRRMRKQMDENEKMAASHFVIVNDDRSSVIEQTYALHLHFLSL